MKSRFAYPVKLSPQPDGSVLAEVPDLPGCVTDGDDRADAMVQIVDALEQMLGSLISARETIPEPSPARGRPYAIPCTVITAKAALYEAMRETRTTSVALAKALGVDEAEIRRMLNPKHATKIGRLEKALAHFGQRLVVTVEAA